MTEFERRIEKRNYGMAMRKTSAELIAKLYDRGYSVSDIAKITGVSENGVAKRILERPECVLQD